MPFTNTRPRADRRRAGEPRRPDEPPAEDHQRRQRGERHARPRAQRAPTVVTRQSAAAALSHDATACVFCPFSLCTITSSHLFHTSSLTERRSSPILAGCSLTRVQFEARTSSRFLPITSPSTGVAATISSDGPAMIVCRVVSGAAVGVPRAGGGSRAVVPPARPPARVAGQRGAGRILRVAVHCSTAPHGGGWVEETW